MSAHSVVVEHIVERAETITAVLRQHGVGQACQPHWCEWSVSTDAGHRYLLPTMPLIDDHPQVGDRLTVWLATPEGPLLAFCVNDGLTLSVEQRVQL